MRKFIFPIAIVLLLVAGEINAQGQFGLGIVVGEPTGVSAKYWASGTNAFDFGAAWSFKGDGNLLLQADYVWHTFSLIPVREGKLPFYFGIGGRVIFSHDPLIGARIPLGLDYIFTNAPIDVFAEIVPILDLAPETNFNLGGGIGVRFWFR